MIAPRVFITHQSACLYWVHRDLHETKESRAQPAASDKQYLETLNDIRNIIIGLEDNDQVHVTVLETKNRHLVSNAIIHHRATPYPNWSFRQINRNTFVASPELCFLNAATFLPFNSLVLYGMELCGTYARTGSLEYPRYKRPVLTNIKRIEAYLEKSGNTDGIKKAKRACHYILDGSASFRESVLATIMTFPPRLGGFGMPKPQLNYGIPVELYSKINPTEQLQLHGDIVWPLAKLVVEYDGAQHGFEDNHASDKQRDHLLLEAGYEVIRVTDKSVRSGTELSRLAQTINRKAKLRKTKSELQWSTQRQQTLTDLLFRCNPPWICE